MGALEADGVGRWKRLTLGSRCYRFGRSMEPERSQINLYTRFPLFQCMLLTDNYYFPLLKRVSVYFVQHRSEAVGGRRRGEGMDAKACQTVITCNYRFRWVGGGGAHNRRKGIASRREF